MNNEEMKDKIKSNIKEIIALSNVKEEINIKNFKRRKIFHIILPSCIIFVLCSFILINNYNKLTIQKSKEDEIKDYKNNNIILDHYIDSNNINVSIADVIKKIDKNKIFYKKVENKQTLSFEYEPTIENLYNMSDIVVIGKYRSKEKVYTNGVNICTETNFDVYRVIKNTTELNVSQKITFNINGGVLTLDKYIENNPTIKEGEFVDIDENIRKDYYVIHEYGPENRLDFANTNGDLKEYILFLNYRNDKLSPCTDYYGIREIKDKKVYDYDTDNFIKVKNKEINNILNEIK